MNAVPSLIDNTCDKIVTFGYANCARTGRNMELRNALCDPARDQIIHPEYNIAVPN